MRMSLTNSTMTAVIALALARAASAQPCDIEFQRVHPTDDPSFGVEGLNVIDMGAGPELFVGGHFDTIGGLPFNKVARFNGTAFTPIGQGLHPYVENFIGCCSKAFTFARFDDANGPGLYIGGDFIGVWETFPDIVEFSIARWRPTGGGVWQTLDGLVNQDNCVADCPPRVHDSQVIGTPNGPALVIAGTFSSLGFFGPNPVESKYVGTWTSTGWAAMDGGMRVVRAENPEPAVVFSLQLYDDGLGEKLYAGGHFTHAGSVAADSIARWNGTAWEALAGGGIGPNGEEPPRGQINAMTVFNGSLIAGGEFTLAGTTTVSHIARWDGTQWRAMGTGLNAQVRTMAVWDDGFGPALYVGGDFTEAGDAPANHLARWTGTRWESVLDGLDGSVYSMAVFQNELYIGGYFDGNTSGRVHSPYFVKLAPPQCCIADFNDDATVSVQDIFEFLAAYFGGEDRRADINRDGAISVQDIFDYLARYFAGCEF
jgi:hypothetical protein